MPVTVGLQNVGSFQVSGWPYLKKATLDSDEQEFKFNFVSQEITVWNAGGEDLEFYFITASATTFLLPAGKKVSLRVKAGSIFAKSSSGTDIKLFVSMTNIPIQRIGAIPASPAAGDIEDLDGDGVPDWADLFETYAGPYNGSNPSPIGDTNLWMEYDDGAGNFLEFNENEDGKQTPRIAIGTCISSLSFGDIKTKFDNLKAYYEENGAPVELTIPQPSQDDINNYIDLTKQNVDQFLPITVERAIGDGNTASVTVNMVIHLVCPPDGVSTAPTILLEIDDALVTFNHGATNDDINTDDVDQGLYQTP